MSLKTKVKAGNITNLSDARYCAGMGVDWLGFPAAVVHAGAFKEITDWVTGPEYVLELSDKTTIDSIREYPVSILEISLHQVHLIERLPDMRWMVKLLLSEWEAGQQELLPYQDKIDYLVVEPDTHLLTELSDIAQHFKILIQPTDTMSIPDLLALPVDGINVLGENELKPGLKDFEKLSSILEELEVAD